MGLNEEKISTATKVTLSDIIHSFLAENTGKERKSKICTVNILTERIVFGGSNLPYSMNFLFFLKNIVFKKDVWSMLFFFQFYRICCWGCALLVITFLPLYLNL